MKSQTAWTKLEAREVFGALLPVSRDSGDRDEESSGLDILPSRLWGSYLVSREDGRLGLMYPARFSFVGLRTSASARPGDP